MASRLSLKSISRQFDDRLAVDNLSLDVSEGELVCLLGPSGCGKTTALRITAGVDRQTTGSVELDGKIVSDDKQHLQPEKRSVGLMFQDYALFPHLTVAENVRFGLNRKVEKKRISAYLDRVGLSGYEDYYPHHLSGGEQQRVALMRALAPSPSVMLMDEPFSGLDNRLRDGVRDETLSILKQEGAGVLLVTHEPEEALRMADRIALMRGGRIVQIGSPYNIYNYPVDRKAAEFFSDVNIIHGEVKDAQINTPFGYFLTPGMADGADVEVIVRPEHLKLDIDIAGKPPETDAKTGVPAKGIVSRSRFMGAGSLVEINMEHDGSQLSASIPGVFLPDQGTGIWMSLRRDNCFVFPCANQTKLSSPWLSDVRAGGATGH